MALTDDQLQQVVSREHFSQLPAASPDAPGLMVCILVLRDGSTASASVDPQTLEDPLDAGAARAAARSAVGAHAAAEIDAERFAALLAA